jgi:DNA helicase II / ATP-dependent DNA helicase PcrA
MAWNDNLAGPHLQIAAFPGSPLRVIAGPGTGKTFALMRRITRFLESGLSANEILAVTFTRTAASDLVAKLAALGAPGAQTVRACTLHSLAFSVLAKAEVLALTNRVARPLLSHELKMLVQDLADNFGGRKATRRLIRAFESYWATLQTDEPGWPHEPLEQQFDVALRQWLDFHRALLLGELVPVALRFIRDNPHSLHVPSFTHVLADEYQDLNRADQALIDQLAGTGNVVVVGDPDQSIYRFRFANPEAMADYSSTHPGTHDEVLGECRRCPQRIVAMAATLVSNNPRPAQPVLLPFPHNPHGDVSIVQHTSLQAEADTLSAFLDWYLAQHPDVPAGEILVLTNRRRMGYLIRDSLNNVAVQNLRLWAAQSFFYEEALDESTAQEGFLLLTLLSDPDDRVALRTWVGLGSATARTGGWARIRNHCLQAGASPRDTLNALVAGTLSLPHTGAIVERFSELNTRLQQLAGLTGQSLVDAIFPPATPGCEDIRGAATAAALEHPAPADLLQELRTVITQPEIPGDQSNIIRVMSLHKSKGLTARVVVVAGCVAGAIPTVDRDEPPDEQLRQIQEQRRLFYVAITRTTDVLVISGAARMPFGDAKQMNLQFGSGPGGNVTLIASPFLQQLGPQRPQTETGQAWRARLGF